MPTLEVVNFNIVCATLGGFIALFGLVSYLLKEHYYLSEALISTIAGVIFSPPAANLIRPLEYALGNQETLGTITLYFSRLVLGVQLVLAGVQLPSKYLQKEWKSLALLLGPGMTVMWVISSLLIWAMVPNLRFVYALAVGACITPTDPVLSNTIVKGKFADKNIPRDLQRIVIAESGANDGLGYPFLFLPLYLIKFVLEGGAGSSGNAGTAIGMWFYETWVYEIVLGVVYGATCGWIAKELLHWAESKKYVDRESFLVFAIALALFIIGTVGLIGSDDVLACFIAGNTFTWDDWFRIETEDDSLQPTIDMLLNVTIFIWFGAVCPWHMFVHNTVIPIHRLIILGILILLLRRPLIIFAMQTKIRQIEVWQQALFVGFFGPIGVSAIFYLYITLKFLRDDIQVDGREREDAVMLGEVMTVVIWFVVICSIASSLSRQSLNDSNLIQVIHGLSIPVGKLGLYIPRTLSSARTSDSGQDNSTFRVGKVPATDEAVRRDTNVETVSPSSPSNHVALPRPLYRIGGSIIRNRSSPRSHDTSTHVAPTARTPGAASSLESTEDAAQASHGIELSSLSTQRPTEARAIRFNDERAETRVLPDANTENKQMRDLEAAK